MNPENQNETDEKATIIKYNGKESILFDSFDDWVSEYRKKENLNEREVEIELSDMETVDKMLDDMYARGCRPIVSIGDDKMDGVLKSGLHPHVTWDRVMRIDASFGRPPFLPSSQKRHLLVLDVPRNRIAPRYTKKGDGVRSFVGIVQISGSKVELKDMRTLDPKKEFEDGIGQIRESIKKSHEKENPLSA